MLGVVWAVVGPTAVGKTALGIALAERLGTEVIGCDARQFYREMAIGTAAPTAEEQTRVAHHFVGQRSVTEDFSAGAYAAEARPLLEGLLERRGHVVVVGGSGLYLKALLDGLDEVPKSMPIREALTERYREGGLGPLLAELDAVDPVSGARIDRANPQRVIRALEATLAGGRPFSSYHSDTPRPRPFHVVYVGLEGPAEWLTERIRTRTDHMIAAGWEAEARALLPHRQQNALQTVGYREWFDAFDGKLVREDLAYTIALHTRQYAKRQLTWFRKIPDVQWFDARTPQRVMDWVEQHPLRNNPRTSAV
jgi:tRNA dimethylallyltransferase